MNPRPRNSCRKRNSETQLLNKGKRLISTTRHCECAILAACLFNGKKERFDLFVHASLHAPPRKYFLFDLCLCSLKEKKSLRLFLYDDEGRIELAPPKKSVKDARDSFTTQNCLWYTHNFHAEIQIINSSE